MTQAAVEFAELELDALTELVNLGVSKAATNLAQMVHEEVVLTVPSVALLGRQEAIRVLGEREAKELVAVHQVFEGDITGRVLLIFPEEKSLELVRAVTGGELSVEELIELEQEALAETGNVILNGCLATIANLLARRCWNGSGSRDNNRLDGPSARSIARVHATSVSTESHGRQTCILGISRSVAACSTGWCVGPSWPRPIESWVNTHTTRCFISAAMRSALRA
jgi:CheY-specific phosphatase CheX